MRNLPRIDKQVPFASSGFRLFLESMSHSEEGW